MVIRMVLALLLLGRVASAAAEHPQTGPAIGPPAAIKIEPPAAIPAADLLKSHPSPSDTVFVDVRPAESFRRLRIPGSLNIPLFAVKTKSFLRGKAVVLVNEGFESRRLEQECPAVLSSGARSVGVLEGGIAFWAVLGGPLEGEPSRLPALRLISPNSFAAEKQLRHLLVVATGSADDKTQRLLPEAIRVPLESGGEDFTARLVDALRTEIAGRLSTVVLVDDRGESYPHLVSLTQEKRFQGARSANFYFLEGGLEGYGVHQERETALLQGQGKRAVGGCPECPQGRSR